MWKEFKDFAMKGNVVDLAVGVIIGGAFGKIVSSLVADIIMPILALLLGVFKISNLAYKSIHYGIFLQSVVDFFIIAFSIFLFVKFINRFKRKEKEENALVAEKTDHIEDLLIEIRDLLKEDRDFSRKNETS